MPAHIRKGLITGAPAFNSGGLGLSIGSRVGGTRHRIAQRAPDSVKIASATSGGGGGGGGETPTLYKFKGGDAEGEPGVTEQTSLEGIYAKVTEPVASVIGDFMAMNIITPISETEIQDHMFLHEIPTIDDIVLCHTDGALLGLDSGSYSFSNKCITIKINSTGGSLTSLFIKKTATPNVYNMTFPSGLVFSVDNDDIENGTNTFSSEGIDYTFKQTYDDYSEGVSTGENEEAAAVVSLVNAIKGQNYVITMVRDNVFKIGSPLTSANNNAYEFSHNAGF